MRKIFYLILFIYFRMWFWIDIQWEAIGNDVVIQIENIIPNNDVYYAEVTLESGSKIAVKLGKPDEEGIFQIRNTFEKFSIFLFTLI